MTKEAREEMALANVTGRSCFINPYINHETVPANIIEYIGNERSPVDFVLTVFITWGKNAVVVKNAAVNPIIFIEFINARYETVLSW